MIRNSHGFVSILFMLFVIPLIALAATHALISYTSASKDLYRRQCIQWGLKAQYRLSDITDDIFKLNPLSSQLRFKLKTLQTALFAAISSGNSVLAAQLQIQIQQVQTQQLQLDQLQKQKIGQADLEISQLKQNYLFETKMALQKFDHSWALLLMTENNFSILKSPYLGVQPDSIGGLAPNYELSAIYKQQRIMAFEWQNRHQLWKKSNNGPSQKQSLRIICEITAVYENRKWIYQTRLDNL